MKTQVLGTGPPSPRISTSAVPGWDLRICTSNKLPGNAEAAIWGSHFENHWSRRVQTAKYIAHTLKEFVG